MRRERSDVSGPIIRPVLPLQPGARIGGYEIVSLLGAGGMGEVYRSRDMRLGRDVAIKIVSPRIAADAERLTGYHVGGISPFGQKKRVPVAIEAAALGHESVFLNGGQRGLQVELDPNDAVQAAGAITRPLTA